jgi:multiple sugar transport system substrate-binding protein
MLSVLALAACGGDGSDGTPATSEDPGGGNATYCGVEARTASETSALKRFNRAHRDKGLTARWRTVGRVTAVPDVCDVALVDASTVAERAANGEIADLTERVEPRKDEFVGNTLDAVRYRDRYGGVPRSVDVGFIYYETQAGTPPLAWQDVYRLARSARGFVYAGARGPELTAHFLEVAYAAGGKVLSDDGSASELDSPENLRALTLMRRGITSGAVPREVTRMEEEDARRAFDRGASVMRNRTYAYRASDVGEWEPWKTAEVIELPAFGSGEPTAIMGGGIVVVAADAAEEEAALALADHLTGDEEAKRVTKRFKLPTAMAATYDDVTILDHIPYSPELERTLEVARPLPASPHWREISAAIARHVHAALTGRESPRGALRAAHGDVNAILTG